MLSREQRRQLEAEWSSDDRSIASFARLVKTGVLSIMVLALVWMAGTGDRQDDSGQQTASGVPSITRVQGEGSALRASQQVYDERRAQWESKVAKPLRQVATQ